MRDTRYLRRITACLGFSSLLCAALAQAQLRIDESPTTPIKPLEPVVRIRCGGYVTHNRDTGAGSLRDAVVNPPGLLAGAICFDSAVFNKNAALASRTIRVASPILLAKNVWIAGPGGDAVMVSGGDSTRIFTVAAGVSATLQGITVHDGYANFGGGIYNDRGKLTLSGARLVQNGATSGGGIYSNEGEVLIKKSELISNWATSSGPTGNGGGIYGYYSASLRILDSVLELNSATNSGGAIANVECDDMRIEDSELSTNSARLGAGAFTTTHGTVTLVRSLVTGNGASGSGAGLHVYDWGTPVLLEDTELSYNWAFGSGGGIAINNPGLGSTLTRVTLQGGSVIHSNAGSAGGGIHADGATLINAVSGTNVHSNLPNDITP
ncbi:MAG TPA: hypothetical protein VK524_09795 [Polyangiaceae bacterium]|nr:hypothetical protein [Polyangiaceae bacterium]